MKVFNVLCVSEDYVVSIDSFSSLEKAQKFLIDDYNNTLQRVMSVLNSFCNKKAGKIVYEINGEKLFWEWKIQGCIIDYLV